MKKEILLQEAEKKNAECAFYIKNLKGDGEWEYQSSKVVPSASLIKMFLLAEAIGRIREGTLSMAQPILVRKEDMVAFSVLEFLKPREYTLEELLRLMIVYSDNTATNVLMDFLGMEQINHRIKTLGYKDSCLRRKMMDFEAAKAGRENLTTVKDMADLLQRLYDNNLLGSPYDEMMLEIMRGQSDECMMRQELPDEIMIARKSGELDCLDHDIAIVYGEQTDYLYCFFVWGAVSNNDAREVLAQTSKLVYNFFEGDRS